MPILQEVLGYEPDLVVLYTDVTLNKPLRLEFGPFSVADYFEGDICFVRLELDDDGTANVDFAVAEIAMTAVRWKHGEHL